MPVRVVGHGFSYTFYVNIEGEQVGEHISNVVVNVRVPGKLSSYFLRLEEDLNDFLFRLRSGERSPKRIKPVIEGHLLVGRANLSFSDPAPNLPSLISRIFSGYGPNWGGLQTRWV